MVCGGVHVMCACLCRWSINAALIVAIVTIDAPFPTTIIAILAINIATNPTFTTTNPTFSQSAIDAWNQASCNCCTA